MTLLQQKWNHIPFQSLYNTKQCIRQQEHQNTINALIAFTKSNSSSSFVVVAYCKVGDGVNCNGRERRQIVAMLAPPLGFAQGEAIKTRPWETKQKSRTRLAHKVEKKAMFGLFLSVAHKYRSRWVVVHPHCRLAVETCS